MPELPEVETVVRRLHGLRDPLIGRVFTCVHAGWLPMIQRSPINLEEGLPGQRIEGIDRRGKYIVFSLHGNRTMLIHLKMTGHLYVSSMSEADHHHDRVVFHLDDGRQLRFRDPRKFGRVYLTMNPDDVLGHLGPEPLSDAFLERHFLNLLDGRRGSIKPLLMNQAFVAGIGNIYADESLFAAGVRPIRHVNTLKEAEKCALYYAIRRVLSSAIQHQGSTLTDGTFQNGQYQDHFYVYGRSGEPCLKCGHVIERIKVGQRSSHFCPVCQR